ncbi:hypothetical protein [Chitinophaga sp. MD30]|uniref:hypothetical protein n=1 Tax=Chitinophaga sp. MD30 TaxID=2033437 RepID=UPI0012FD79ED|nr:hypothetical protein [Chitinophaga sp. MD30]
MLPAYLGQTDSSRTIPLTDDLTGLTVGADHPIYNNTLPRPLHRQPSDHAARYRE